MPNRTLTAESGSFALTGQAAGMLADLVVAASGSFGLTGNDAGFKFGTVDRFRGHQLGLASPVEHAYTPTASDTDNLPYFSRAIWVGTAGHVKLVTVQGDTITLKNVIAGRWHFIRAKQIWSTGTTAADLIVGY